MRDRTARLVAVAALVVGVLGWTGVGEAVRQAVVPPNSVGTPELKRNAVTTEKIHGGTIVSSDIRDGAITARDLARGVVPKGLAFVVRRAVKDIPGVGQFDLTVSCDPDQVPVSGGGGFLSATGPTYTGNDFYGGLTNSGPISLENASDDRGTVSGWQVTARNAGGKKRLAAYVICAYTPADAPAPDATPPTPPSAPGAG
jgi:hypothetical protein